jgi:hypothetical protein
LTVSGYRSFLPFPSPSRRAACLGGDRLADLGGSPSRQCSRT